MKKNGPDFICIGAQASGTSWLYQQLKKHPGFAFPNRKEVHHFDRKNFIQRSTGNIDRLIDIFKLSGSLLDGFKLLINRVQRRYRILRYGTLKKERKLKYSTYKKRKIVLESDSAYISIFDTTLITGDITPAYSTLPDAKVEQMAKLLPNAKIIFLIRNPIDRNWSAYRKKLKQKAYKEYTELEMKYFFNQNGVVERTNYLATIDRYTSYFGKQNILIGFYDAIIAEPDVLLSNIIEFLGGDPDIAHPQDQVKKIINESPKSDIPADIELFLKDKYTPLIEALSRRYGSYATRWLDDLKGIDNRETEYKATVDS
jgi:hypothetical protein